MNFVWLFVAASSLALVHVNGQCRGKVDLVIAVPGNNTVPFYEFDVFEKWLTRLVNYFDIAYDQFNIGLVLYGSRPVDIAWPQLFKNRQKTNTRITFVGRRSLYEHSIVGALNVSSAIESITWMLTNPPPGYATNILRPDAHKIGVLLVYGAATNPDDVIEKAKIARNNGIKLYALGTNGTGPEFESIGYDHCRLFSLQSFSTGLPAAIPDLASSICSEVDPSVTVRPGNCFPKRYPSVAEHRVRCGPNITILPDPDNCAYFYQCVHGKPTHQECVLNTIFDVHTGSCNFKEDVSCWANVDLRCPLPIGQFEHPNYCSKFINCHDGAAHVMECPAGMWFNPSNSSCVEQGSLFCPLHKIQ